MSVSAVDTPGPEPITEPPLAGLLRDAVRRARERRAGGGAWDAFADSVPQDVTAEGMAAAGAPAPLAAALEAAGPVTPLHGDLRDDNLGLADGRVVLLDLDCLRRQGTTTENDPCPAP